MAGESVGQMLTLILRFGSSSSSSTSGFLVNYSRVVVILRVAVMGNSWDFHAELRSAPLLLFSVDSQPVELNCCWVEGEDVRRETTETAEAAQCALLTNVDSVVFSRDSARVQSRRICRWSKAASSTTQWWFIEKDEVFNCPEDWLIVFIDPHGMRLLYSFNINAATILEWTICHKFHKFSSCKIQCQVS